MMKPTKLHYVYDPLCGWCYGAAPLLKAAAALPGLAVALHAGGLWLGPRRQPMGPALRAAVRPHDERIAALSGQLFGERYRDELLLDTRLTLDSEPPIRALLAVSALGGDALALLHRLQETHYRDGLWIGDIDRLVLLAQEIGMDASTFRQAYAAAPLTAYLAESQQWVQRIGGHGYPTLALARQDQLLAIDVAAFLGQPAAFAHHLAGLLAG